MSKVSWDRVALPLLAGLALAGCGGGAQTVPQDRQAAEIVVGEPDRDVPAVLIGSTEFSGVRGSRNAVIQDEATFSAMWPWYAANLRDANGNLPPMPEVDFSKQMVLGVFGGPLPNGCYSTAIGGITTDGKSISVRRDNVVPPSGAVCPATVPAPAQLVVVARSEQPVAFVDHQVQQVPAAALDTTSVSGVRASRNVVIKDEETFSAMWAQHASPVRDADGNIRPLPQVDFSKQMVIGVFGGQLPNGCYSTGIAGIVADGAKISVRRTDTVPGKNTVCPTNLPSPGQLVAVERSSLPVEFFSEQVVLHPGQ